MREAASPILKEVAVITGGGHTDVTYFNSGENLSATTGGGTLNGQAPSIATRARTANLDLSTDFQHEVVQPQVIQRVRRNINGISLGN
jgi:hypothetical protein